VIGSYRSTRPPLDSAPSMCSVCSLAQPLSIRTAGYTRAVKLRRRARVLPLAGIGEAGRRALKGADRSLGNRAAPLPAQLRDSCRRGYLHSTRVTTSQTFFWNRNVRVHSVTVTLLSHSVTGSAPSSAPYTCGDCSLPASGANGAPHEVQTFEWSGIDRFRRVSCTPVPARPACVDQRSRVRRRVFDESGEVAVTRIWSGHRFGKVRHRGMSWRTVGDGDRRSSAGEHVGPAFTGGWCCPYGAWAVAGPRVSACRTP